MNFSQTVLIVGGIVRPLILQKLRRVFIGMTVDWIPTRESDPSSSVFVFQLRREETRLVVILAGVMRHQHVHDLVGQARRYGKRVLHLYRSQNAQRIRAALSTAATVVPLTTNGAALHIHFPARCPCGIQINPRN